eukprot:GDKJ01029318.1.p1 GENE.GDKJ01029318.1~~GDKJ01029318.1.p1  ORF type:complete len:1163 (-),score=285.43 GDKJ01029318.1:827-3952(-)
MEKTSVDLSSALSKHIQSSEAKMSTLDLSLAELTQTVEQYAGVTQQRKIDNLERLALSQANEISKMKSEIEREKQTRLQLESEITRRLDQLTVRMDDSIARVATESAQRDGLLNDQVRNASKSGYGNQESTILVSRLESDVASLAAVLDRRILALEDGSQMLAVTIQERHKELDLKLRSIAQQASEEIAKARIESQDLLSNATLNGEINGVPDLAAILNDVDVRLGTCRADIEALAGVNGRLESAVEEQRMFLGEMSKVNEVVKDDMSRVRENVAVVRNRVESEIEATRARVSQELSDCKREVAILISDEKKRFSEQDSALRVYVDSKATEMDGAIDDIALVLESVKKDLKDETLERVARQKDVELNVSTMDVRLNNRILQVSEANERAIERTSSELKGWMTSELERAEGVLRDVLYSEQESLRTFRKQIEDKQTAESERNDNNLEKLDRRLVSVVKAVREATLASMDQMRRDLMSQNDISLDRVHDRIEQVAEVIKTDRDQNLTQFAALENSKKEIIAQMQENASLGAKAVHLLREALEQQVENTAEDLRMSMQAQVSSAVSDSAAVLRSQIEGEKVQRAGMIKEMISTMDSRCDAMERGAQAREVQMRNDLHSLVENAKTANNQLTSAVRDELLEITNGVRSREIQMKVDLNARFEEAKLVSAHALTELREEVLSLTGDLKNRDNQFVNELADRVEEVKIKTGEAISIVRQEFQEVTHAIKMKEGQSRSEMLARDDDLKAQIAVSKAELREELIQSLNAVKARELQARTEATSKIEESKNATGLAISAVRDEFLNITDNLRDEILSSDNKRSAMVREQIKESQETLMQRLSEVSTRAEDISRRSSADTVRSVEEKLSAFNIQVHDNVSQMVRDSVTQGRALALQQVRTEVLRETDQQIGTLKTDLMRELEVTRRDIKVLSDASIDQNITRVEARLRESITATAQEMSAPLELQLSTLSRKLDQTILQLSEKINSVDNDGSNVASTVIKLDVDLRNQVKQLKEFVTLMKDAVDSLLSSPPAQPVRQTPPSAASARPAASS